MPESVVRRTFGVGRCWVTVSSRPSAMDPQALLVFLHGRFGDARIWARMERDLARTFHCLTIDLPGYGRAGEFGSTELSWLEEGRRTLCLFLDTEWRSTDVVLIGHDVGAGIAQQVALESRRKIAGTVLINPACLNSALRMLPLRFRGSLLHWKLRELLNDAPAMDWITRRQLREQWGRPESRRRLLPALKDLQERWPEDAERLDWGKKLESHTRPVLILWGLHDRLNLAENGEKLLRMLPEGYFFVNERCGHWPSVEDPTWVTQKMREFLFRILPMTQTSNKRCGAPFG